MARPEYQGCPPGVVRGSAAHPSIASALNHTVRLPRRRRLASYAGQFVTLCVCLGTWRRRVWFSLKGKAGILGQVRGSLLRPAGFERHRAAPCTKATRVTAGRELLFRKDQMHYEIEIREHDHGS